MNIYHNQRVAVLVDVQNLFYSAKYQYHAKVNFSKLMDKALAGRQLTRALAYIVKTPDIDQTSFLEMLKSKGFEIRSKDLRIRPDKTSKGDWDMGIAIDAISMAGRLDVIVLVSGDGDFIDLVKMLKGNGLIVEIISFPKSTNDDLIKESTKYIPIEEEMLIYDDHRRARPRSRS